MVYLEKYDQNVDNDNNDLIEKSPSKVRRDDDLIEKSPSRVRGDNDLIGKSPSKIRTINYEERFEELTKIISEQEKEIKMYNYYSKSNMSLNAIDRENSINYFKKLEEKSIYLHITQHFN